MQKILYKLALCVLFSSSLPAFSEDAQGDWMGKIAGQLRLHVHVEKSSRGIWTVNLRSPDQGNMKIDADQVEVTDQRLSFAISGLHANFDSKWDEVSKTWKGQWHQGQDLPLSLSRMDAQAASAATGLPKRPQEEKISKDTLPYRSEEVNFSSKSKQFQLAGTYSVPQGVGPFPAVILVHGSGPNTRNEEIFGHKIFLVLADHLNRQGIAVLRYDKRGTGASKGDYAKATSVDFSDDAHAALAYLRNRTEVNQEKIGVIGHSEGGMIAPMLANHDEHLAFLVMLAGPGIRGDKLLPEQKRLVMKAGGASDKDIADTVKSDQIIYTAIAHSTSDVQAVRAVETILQNLVKEKQISNAQADALLRQVTSPWMLYFLSYDPAPELRKLQLAILVLNGEKDMQVPAKMNLNAIRDALVNNNKATIKELPQLNHLFQTAETGSPSEYGSIEETFAPSALKIISDWIHQQTLSSGSH